MNPPTCSKKKFRIIPILVVLLTFQMVIVIHEYGHYTELKKRNIEVKEFWIGYGLQIFSFQKDNLLIKLKLFPIGGRLVHSDESLIALEELPLWEKIIIYLGGVRNNFIAALVTALLFQVFIVKKRKILPITIITEPLKLMAESAFLIWKSIFWREKDLYDERFVPSPEDKIRSRPIQKFVFLNYAFAFFNLLPLLPLDGGKILISAIPELFILAPETVKTIENVLFLIFALILVRSGFAVKRALEIDKRRTNNRTETIKSSS